MSRTSGSLASSCRSRTSSSPSLTNSSSSSAVASVGERLPSLALERQSRGRRGDRGHWRRCGMIVQAAAQLAAGGFDGLSLGLANRRADASIAQQARELKDRGPARPLKRKTRDRIVRDQVDMGLSSLQLPCQGTSIGWTVVDPVEQDILISDLAARGLKVEIGCLEHGLQADLRIDRHEPITKLISWRMQGNRQVVLTIESRELADL